MTPSSRWQGRCPEPSCRSCQEWRLLEHREDESAYFTDRTEDDSVWSLQQMPEKHGTKFNACSRNWEKEGIDLHSLKLTANPVLHDRVPLSIKNNTRASIWLLVFNIVLGFQPAKEGRKRKEKSYTLERKESNSLYLQTTWWYVENSRWSTKFGWNLQ